MSKEKEIAESAAEPKLWMKAAVEEMVQRGDLDEMYAERAEESIAAHAPLEAVPGCETGTDDVAKQVAELRYAMSLRSDALPMYYNRIKATAAALGKRERELAELKLALECNVAKLSMEDVTKLVKSMPVRVERIGGQNANYINRDELLDALELWRKR